jgi:hypothetical protein
MSQGINYLHSHSGLERTLRETANDKFHVLIDKEFKSMFEDCSVKPFKHGGKQYYKVPTYAFFRKGGVFKNLYS